MPTLQTAFPWWTSLSPVCKSPCRCGFQYLLEWVGIPGVFWKSQTDFVFPLFSALEQIPVVCSYSSARRRWREAPEKPGKQPLRRAAGRQFLVCLLLCVCRAACAHRPVWGWGLCLSCSLSVSPLQHPHSGTTQASWPRGLCLQPWELGYYVPSRSRTPRFGNSWGHIWCWRWELRPLALMTCFNLGFADLLYEWKWFQS